MTRYLLYYNSDDDTCSFYRHVYDNGTITMYEYYTRNSCLLKNYDTWHFLLLLLRPSYTTICYYLYAPVRSTNLIDRVTYYKMYMCYCRTKYFVRDTYYIMYMWKLFYVLLLLPWIINIFLTSWKIFRQNILVKILAHNFVCIVFKQQAATTTNNINNIETNYHEQFRRGSSPNRYTNCRFWYRTTSESYYARRNYRHWRK